MDHEGNIDEENMLLLYHFEDDFKHRKLEKINDPLARNLVSQMLSKDSAKRPNIQQILGEK
jgi:hypothetical protein